MDSQLLEVALSRIAVREFVLPNDVVYNSWIATYRTMQLLLLLQLIAESKCDSIIILVILLQQS